MATDRFISPTRPHTSLQRGRACGNCRRRKIRCDGTKPRCTPCSRNSRAIEECEYKDAGLSRTQMLEANIVRLEARIRELESPAQNITLYQPYDESGSNSVDPHSPQSSPAFSAISPRGASNRSSRSNTPSLGYTSDDGFEVRASLSAPFGTILTSAYQEPPIDTAKVLLHIFVPYASEFGFFLNPDRFLKSALLPFPAGHQSRPCTSLLAAVYLWGVCLSQDEALLAQERDYLVLALQLLAHELASDHPDKIMHSIQAEVLLAVYFFRAGRFLEGKYHASAATSLAISSGLHRIRSVTATNSILHTLDDVLPIPMDEVEEAGRIAGFWSVYVLNTCWSAVLRSPPSCAFDSPGLHIDTPWPLEFEQYKNIPKNLHGSHTIRKFLEGTSEPTFGEYSIPAMLAKASILYHRSTRLVAQCHDNMPPEGFSEFAVVFTSLNRCVERFLVQMLPPDHPSITEPANLRALLVTHALAHSASIQLHTVYSCTSDLSRNKCLLSARAIIDMIGTANLEHLVHVNPVLGFLWTSAAHILIDEIVRLRAHRSVWKDESTAIDEHGLVAVLNRGFAAIAIIALRSPLLDRQLESLKDSYDSHPKTINDRPFSPKVFAYT